MNTPPQDREKYFIRKAIVVAPYTSDKPRPSWWTKLKKRFGLKS